MKKYKVIFYDGYDEVPYTEQYFDSEIEAENWLNDQKSYSDDYFEVDYYNPQDKQKYIGYKINPINELNEEFIRMQKLAGLITEEEYKARLWYK